LKEKRKRRLREMEDTTHDQHHNEQQQEETPASEVSLSEDLEGRKGPVVWREMCGGGCVWI
jgi:hypothetical protein